MAERRGVLQNVQGPRPSLTQITLPQFRQLGAAARSAWRVAMQLHFREAVEARRVLFVLSSSVRIAESSAERVVELPCMDWPPVMLILVVFGAGGCVGFDLGLEKSDIKAPAAEGGAFGLEVMAGLGVSAKALLLLDAGFGAGRLEM